MLTNKKAGCKIKQGSGFYNLFRHKYKEVLLQGVTALDADALDRSRA